MKKCNLIIVRIALISMLICCLSFVGKQINVQAKENITVNLDNNQKVYIFKKSTYDDSIKAENRYIEYYVSATNSNGEMVNYFKCKSSNKNVADIIDNNKIRFYKPGETTITIKSGKNMVRRKVIVKKALGWKDVFSIGKKYRYSKDGIANIKLTNKLPYIVIGKIKYDVYDLDGNLKQKNSSSTVFVGPKETIVHQLVDVYAKKGDYIKIKGIYNFECKQFASNNTKYPTIENTIYRVPNFPYMEYYCKIKNPYNYGIYVPYDVYFYSSQETLYRIEHRYTYIKSGETQNLKSTYRVTYDEKQEIRIGKIVVYQNGKEPVGSVKKDETFLRGINIVNNSGFEKSDYSMWNIKHPIVNEVRIDSDGSIPIGIDTESANAHTQNRSLHFWTPYDDEFSVEQVVKKEKLVKGTYQASVYIQGDEIGKDAEIYLYVITNEKKYTSSLADLDGYNNWKKLTIKNIEHKSGDMFIGVKVKHAADGWGFIDDFYLFTPYK